MKQQLLKVRTKGYVLLNGMSFPPGTVLEVPEARALQMVGDGQAEQISDEGDSKKMPQQIGPEKPPVTADNYKPEFLTNVVTTSMNGQETPVNPVYCLQRRSADQLAVILKDLTPEIVMADPYYVYAGVRVSSLVPWFRFPSGCAVNAGVEGNWWSNASGKTAETNCRKDIEAAQQQFYVEGSGQYPQQLQIPPSQGS